MPFDYRINPDEHIATIRLFDRVIEVDILGALEALHADSSYQLDMHRIWDLREVTELLLKLDQADAIKTAISSLNQGGRTAFVVTRTIDAMAAHFFRLHIRERPIQVFGSMEEARAWVLKQKGPT